MYERERSDTNFLVVIRARLFSNASSSRAAENLNVFKWYLNSAKVDSREGVHFLLFFPCCVVEDLIGLLSLSSDLGPIAARTKDLVYKR